jgi:hypothetical protein
LNIDVDVPCNVTGVRRGPVGHADVHIRGFDCVNLVSLCEAFVEEILLSSRVEESDGRFAVDVHGVCDEDVGEIREFDSIAIYGLGSETAAGGGVGVGVVGGPVLNWSTVENTARGADVALSDQRVSTCFPGRCGHHLAFGEEGTTSVTLMRDVGFLRWSWLNARSVSLKRGRCPTIRRWEKCLPCVFTD